MGELALMAEEILKLERLISPTLSPSISLLFYFFSDQPSIFDYVEGLLEEFKKYLAYREGFHSTLEAHSLKEESMLPSREFHFGTTRLACSFFDEMRDSPSTDLETSSLPLLTRQAGFLTMVVLKDRLAIRQCVSVKLGDHKE
ncbi:hypothetical protein AMTRI_Chr03g142780 [Amborella trichopoda]